MKSLIRLKKYVLLFLCITFSISAMDGKNPLVLVNDLCSSCSAPVTAMVSEISTLKQEVAGFRKEKSDWDKNLNDLQLKYRQASEDTGNNASPRKKVPENAVSNAFQKNKTLTEDNNAFLVQLARLQAERGSSDEKIERLNQEISVLKVASVGKSKQLDMLTKQLKEERALCADHAQQSLDQIRRINELNENLITEAQGRVSEIGTEKDKLAAELKAVAWKRDLYGIVLFGSIMSILINFLHSRYVQAHC